VDPVRLIAAIGPAKIAWPLSSRGEEQADSEGGHEEEGEGGSPCPQGFLEGSAPAQTVVLVFLVGDDKGYDARQKAKYAAYGGEEQHRHCVSSAPSTARRPQQSVDPR
jgi:hypothetical protein